jgi:hypothetical protein
LRELENFRTALLGGFDSDTEVMGFEKDKNASL